MIKKTFIKRFFRDERKGIKKAKSCGSGLNNIDTPQNNINTLFDEKCSITDESQNLPSISESAPIEKEIIFIKKLNCCSIIYNNNNKSENQRKCEILDELIFHITNSSRWFSYEILISVKKMICSNIFRSLPKISSYSIDPYDEDQPQDPNWTVLNKVYQFFYKFITSSHSKNKLIHQHFIDQKFIKKFISLFKSEDSRERKALKSILHEIYRDSVSYRCVFRKAIMNEMYMYLYDDRTIMGINELLMTIGSIIDGKSAPLADEYNIILERILIPIHGKNEMPLYSRELAFCIIQFVEKDENYSIIILKGLLRYWPANNSAKQALFLNEIQKLIEKTENKKLSVLIVPLFKKIVECVNSESAQTAEKALFAWKSTKFILLIKENIDVVLPIIYGPVYENLTTHWNIAIKNLSLNVCRTIKSLDEKLYRKCEKEYMKRNNDKNKLFCDKIDRWKLIKRMDKISRN